MTHPHAATESAHLAQWALDANSHVYHEVHQMILSINDVLGFWQDQDMMTRLSHQWATLVHAVEDAWQHLSQIPHSGAAPDWYPGMATQYDRLRHEIHNDAHAMQALTTCQDPNAAATADGIRDGLDAWMRHLDFLAQHLREVQGY